LVFSVPAHQKCQIVDGTIVIVPAFLAILHEAFVVVVVVAGVLGYCSPSVVASCCLSLEVRLFLVFS
jgi:hypothetical protein